MHRACALRMAIRVLFLALLAADLQASPPGAFDPTAARARVHGARGTDLRRGEPRRDVASAGGESARSAAAADGVPIPYEWGPFQIGVTTLELVDASRNDRPVVTDVWYPAQVVPGAAGTYYAHLAWGNASRDAAVDPAGGPYPLVVFSHGYCGLRDQSVFFTEHLASHGFVVMAPDHYGNTIGNCDEMLSADASIDRPLDVSYLIDYGLEQAVAGGFPFGGMVDPDRIGVTGHSYGAYTALVSGGVLVDVEPHREECLAGESFSCEVVRYAEALYGAGVQWLDLSDPRIDAAVPMGPGIYDYFGDAGLAAGHVPFGVMASMQDDTMPYDEEALPIYAGLPAPKYLLSLMHRGHYAYSSAFDMRPFTARRCQSAADCPTRDPSHDIVNAFGVSFLSYYVKDDAGYAAYLAPAFYESTFPGKVILESEP